MKDNKNLQASADAGQPDGRKLYRALVARLMATQYRLLALVAFFDVFAARYYSWFRRKRSDATGHNQIGHLRTFMSVCADLFTKIPVSELTELDIDDACDKMGHALKPGTTEPYANDSYNCYIGALGRLLRYLARPPWKLIPQERLRYMLNVIADYWADSKPRERKLPAPSQQKAMIEYARNQCGRGPERIQSLIFYLLFDFFGIREGMVDLIHRRDLDMSLREISVTFNKRRDGKKVTVIYDIPELLYDTLEQYLATWTGGPDDVLIEVRNISRLIQSAAQAAGLDRFSPHDFRKLFITRALMAGIDTPTVAFLVGHQDGGRSIEKNYYQFCPAHARKSMRRLTARHDIDAETREGRDDQRHWMQLTFDAILASPPEIRERCLKHHHELRDNLAQKNYAGIVAMTPLSAGALPAKANDATPYVPKARPLSEAKAIAANIRNLFWRTGEGYNAVAQQIGLPRTAIYSILKGNQQTDDNLERIAAHFGSHIDYLRDPNLKRCDTDLVIANVSYLAKVFGVTALPSAAALAKVIDGSHLPSGDTLKSLATFINIPLLDFLTRDISQLPIEANKAKAESVRVRIGWNIKVCLLLKCLNVSQGARLIGISARRFNDYVLGTINQPHDHLVVIAAALGVPVAVLQGPAIEVNLPEVGRRIRTLLEKKGYSPSTAALKMGIASKQFRSVACGKLLPNSLQLRRMSTFFESTPAEILGVRILVAVSGRSAGDRDDDKGEAGTCPAAA